MPEATTRLTLAQGLGVLGALALLSFSVTACWARVRSGSKEEFLLANRRVKVLMGACSIAASWTMAPALFVSAQKAYQEGLVGLFWFTAPNVLCMILFAFAAQRFVEMVPRGYSLSDYIRERYGNRAHNMYLLEMGGYAFAAIAVQVFAGALLLRQLTGLPHGWGTTLLMGTALGYCWYSGFKGSVVTDFMKMGIMLAVALVIGPWMLGAVAEQAGRPAWEVVVRGWGGVGGHHAHLFSRESWEVFLSFGLSASIGLLAGPFGDQAYWQRAYGADGRQVRQQFVVAAFVFACIPLTMGALGFIGAGARVPVPDPQLTNLSVILAYLPPWTAVLLLFMVLSGLLSAIDSHLAALSSLVGHDLMNRSGRDVPCHEPMGNQAVRWARLSMAAAAVLAVAVANIPGIKIVYLFLFYGALRSSTLLPTVISIYRRECSEPGLFWGMVLAIFVGLPVFMVGNFTGRPLVMVAGSLLVLALSGGTMLLATVITRDRHTLR